MMSTSDRRRIITVINEALDAGARLVKAIDVLNLSIRTIQRWRRSDRSVREDARPTAKRPTPKTKMSELERMRILDTINQPEFANLPPAVIVPILADRKRFIGSESTNYRVMKEAKQLAHRGKARRATRNLPQALTAYARMRSGAGTSRGCQVQQKETTSICTSSWISLVQTLNQAKYAVGPRKVWQCN